ncbi:MAG TPA: ABC-2 family transporter protein [Herpetosiphonaceae bacterium]
MNVIYIFIRTAFRNTTIYRLNFWISLISTFLMMYGSYSLWTILYQQSPNAFGLDLQRMTTYGVLGMILLPIMDNAMRTQYHIAQQVRTGMLELDMLKPLDFIFHMLSRNLGDFCVLLMTRGVPAFLFAYLFLNFSLPQSGLAACAFLISILLGYLVFFSTSFLMGMLAIVFLDIRSWGWAFSGLVRGASGQLVPLWMYPPALGAFFGLLPFKGIYFIPMALYIGAYEGGTAQALGFQLVWLLALLVAAQITWSRVQGRITVQGG